MRLAAALTALCLFATDLAADGVQIRLDWTEGAGLGSEALVVIRSPEGVPVMSVRERVTEEGTMAQVVLPALTSTAASVQAGLVTEGRVVAQSATRPITGRDFELDLRLSRALAVGFADVWACAEDDTVRIVWTEDGLRAESRDASAEMRATAVEDVYRDTEGSRAAFGVNIAEISIDGREMGACRPTLYPPVLPMDLRALDDDWRIHLGVDRAELDLPGLPEEVAETGIRLAAPRDGTVRVTGTNLDLLLRDMSCRTQVTDLTYPVSASLRDGPEGVTVEGCGGDPLALLAGEAWEVTSLFGIPFNTTTPRMTLRIAGAEISGRTSCNRYLGRAETGNGQLAFRELGTTRLACPTDLSNLELRFLDVLEGATGFDIWRDGTGLTLRAGPIPLLTAQRP